MRIDGTETELTEEGTSRKNGNDERVVRGGEGCLTFSFDELDEDS